MSSATAAPSTVLASTVASARRSPNTRAVMPTLVAVNAAPTNSASLPSMPTRETDARARHKGHDHAGERDGERSAAHAAELVEIHLEADFEQQQDDAELRQGLQCLAAVNPAEHGRTDDHAGDDLADDRREAYAISELGRDLCREEHDEDVEEDSVDVHRDYSVTSVRPPRAVREVQPVAETAYGRDLETKGPDALAETRDVHPNSGRLTLAAPDPFEEGAVGHALVERCDEQFGELLIDR